VVKTLKVYLVEACSLDTKFDEGSLVIALTPLACYQLNKAGVRYTIVENYYDEAELAAGEDAYHQFQLRWMSRLDVFLQENIREVKELKLNLGTIYYLYLKVAVLDPVYLRCYALSRLFTAVKPTSVTFISRSPQKVPLDYNLFNNSRSYYSLIVEALCGQNGIPVESVFLKPDAEKAPETVRRHESLPNRLMAILSRNSLARGIYFFPQRLRFTYRYVKACLYNRQAGQKRLNILMLKLGHIGFDFVIEALNRGHIVYQLSGDFIVKYSCSGTRKKYNLEIERARMAAPDASVWETTAGLLDGHELITSVNKLCESDVSGIIQPGLKHFVSYVCPDIVDYFRVFTEFYRKAKIDFVITPHEVFPAEFAAVAAAGRSRGVTSVNLVHGDSVFAANIWDITWLARYDVNISSNEEMREYFQHRCQVNHFTTRIYRSPHRLLPLKQKGLLREKGGSVKKSRIIYLPSIFMGEHSMFDCAHYPDTWYYELQRALIKYFSTRKEYTFVWKGLPTSDAIYSPIPDFIRDNNFQNIEIATTPFTRHLLTADRVICDYPSTGFYESVIAGIPTISLYHRVLKVRKSAVEYFGRLLVPFSDTPEAVKLIDEFLAADPERYKTAFDTEGPGVLDILEEIDREKS
jgi:hypothetical protein